MPAANVNACSSAIPTSKNRSGNISLKVFKPVPEGIAAVIATIFSLTFAQSITARLKIEV